MSNTKISYKDKLIIFYQPSIFPVNKKTGKRQGCVESVRTKIPEKVLSKRNKDSIIQAWYGSDLLHGDR